MSEKHYELTNTVSRLLTLMFFDFDDEEKIKDLKEYIEYAGYSKEEQEITNKFIDDLILYYKKEN